jgi:single-strand DNA-binding protein
MLNLVVVIGSLCKAPNVRSLPNGISLASFDLQVLRADDAVDVVPVALFDPSERVSAFQAGQEVLAVGRVRRRFFRVGGATQSRTEVVAEHVVPVDLGEEVRSVLGDVGARIGGWLSPPAAG